MSKQSFQLPIGRCRSPRRLAAPPADILTRSFQRPGSGSVAAPAAGSPAHITGAARPHIL